jgi:hypothetical protein
MDEDREDPRQLNKYFVIPYQIVTNPNQLQKKQG